MARILHGNIAVPLSAVEGVHFDPRLSGVRLRRLAVSTRDDEMMVSVIESARPRTG